MACRPPAHCYALFLHEKFLLFCLESIYKDIWYEIEDPIQFLHILNIHDIIRQHLMCELYMHGYYLKHDQSFNPFPFMGDIHLRAFTSYTINQIKWRKVWDTFEENQAGKPLMMRREHGQSSNIYKKHYTFLQIKGHKEHMMAT